MQIYSIQYLRGLAAVAVVCCHLYLTESKGTAGHGFLPAWFAAGDFGVDLFFVISGFIMVFIQSARLDSVAAYFRFLANRATRIYPPYWAVTVPLFLLWLARPQMFNNYYHNHVDIGRTFLLFPQDYAPLLQVGWTLIHEVYFYLVVSIALFFGVRGRWLFGGLWFVAVFTVFLASGDSRFHDHRVLQVIFSPFSLTFLLGYFLGLLHARVRALPSWVALILLGLGVAGLCAGIYWIPGGEPYPNNNHLYRFVGNGVPCALIVAAALRLEAAFPRKIAALSTLGNISYAIYLTHLVMIVALYNLGRVLPLQRPFAALLFASFCFAACLVAAYLFNRVVEVPVTRWSRNVFEGPHRLSPVEK